MPEPSFQQQPPKPTVSVQAPASPPAGPGGPARPEIETTPYNQGPKQHKKFMKKLVIGLAILVVLVAAFWIWRINTTPIESLDLTESEQMELQAGAEVQDLTEAEVDEPGTEQLPEVADAEASMTEEQPIDTSDWLTYRNEELGFEFKYPSEWGAVDFSQQDCFAAGQLYRASLSLNNNVRFGGDSVDCQESRGAEFVDFIRYSDAQGQVVYSHPGGDIEINPSETIFSSDGQKIFIIEDQKIGLLVLENDIGAFLNLDNEEFPGLAFIYSDITNEEKKLLRQLLTSLKLTEVNLITNKDTDGDGLSDDEEVNTWGTDSNNRDSDGDGLSDLQEVKYWGTDPNNSDSDGDSYGDGTEFFNGYNPLGDGQVELNDFETLQVMTPVSVSRAVAEQRAVIDYSGDWRDKYENYDYFLEVTEEDFEISSEWLSYRGEAGFSFEYPAGFNLKDADDINIRDQLVSATRVFPYLFDYSFAVDRPFNKERTQEFLELLSTFEVPDGGEGREFFIEQSKAEAINSDPNFTYYKKVIIDNHEGILSSNRSGDSENQLDWMITLANSSGDFQLTLSGPLWVSDTLDVIERILNSFKFE